MRKIQWLVVLMVCIAFAGCKTEYALQKKDLPPEWRLTPTSKLPPCGEMGWFKDNPQRVPGDPRSKDMREIWYSSYAKDGSDDYVLLIVVIYGSAEEAAKAFAQLKKELSPNDIPPGDMRLIGISQTWNKAVVCLDLPSACPDADFFIKHFNAIAKDVFCGKGKSDDAQN